MRRSISVEMEVDIDEFDDDVLLEEVRRRKLTCVLPEAHSDIEDEDDLRPVDVKAAAMNIQSWLMTRRVDRARENMEKLLAAILPAGIAAADAAIREGRIGDAICELDRFIEPSPAAPATSLPKRPDDMPIAWSPGSGGA
jgi:hypothetical protein